MFSIQMFVPPCPHHSGSEFLWCLARNIVVLSWDQHTHRLQAADFKFICQKIQLEKCGWIQFRLKSAGRNTQTLENIVRCNISCCTFTTFFLHLVLVQFQGVDITILKMQRMSVILMLEDCHDTCLFCRPIGLINITCTFTSMYSRSRQCGPCMA